MTHWESHAERQIREAQERGEFDNLPGLGKPLDLGNPDDPDWWVKRLMAREGIDTSQALHPTLALRREAQTFPQCLADVADESHARELISDFNRRVVEDRRRPVTGTAMPPVAPRLDVEATIDGWRALRAAQAVNNTNNATEAGESRAGQPSGRPANADAPTPPKPPAYRWRWWRRRTNPTPPT